MPRYKPSDPLISKSLRMPSSLFTRLQIQVERHGFRSQTEIILHLIETGVVRLEGNQPSSEIEPV